MTPLEQAWQQQRRWTQAATTSRLRIERRRRVNLMLLVLGAVASAFATLLDTNKGAAAVFTSVAAVALAIAAALQQRALSKEQHQRWVGARVASESLKSLVYRHLMLGSADPASDDSIVADLDRIEAEAADLALDVHDVQSDGKPMPVVTDLDSYIKDRATGQAKWHRDKIDGLKAKARRLHYIELAATGVGAILSALAVGHTDSPLTPFVAALTTIAATVAAHLSAAKYERTAIGYARTSARLQRLVDRLPIEPTKDQAVTFVDDVEQILNEQNSSWMTVLTSA